MSNQGEWAVSEESIDGLKQLSGVLGDMVGKLKDAVSSLRVAFDENASGLGAHSDDINALIEGMDILSSITERYANRLSFKLLKAASIRQAHIDNNPYDSKAHDGSSLEVASFVMNVAKTADKVDDVAGVKNTIKSVQYGDHYDKKKKGLKPDVEYVDPNNYKYVTDSKGRISKVTGGLQLKKGVRNKYAQRIIGGKDRLPTDEGGHLIGTQFNGSGEIDNLVPQSRNINQAGGEWYKMEQIWADALEQGSKVEVDIEPIYSGVSTRPDKFIVRYKVDGSLITKTILNQ